jgi:hypothetical protein
MGNTIQKLTTGWGLCCVGSSSESVGFLGIWRRACVGSTLVVRTSQAKDVTWHDQWIVLT